MAAYLRQFREMVSLRGLTDHTVTSYSTYVRVYLDYLSDILHKMPEEVSWGNCATSSAGSKRPGGFPTAP